MLPIVEPKVARLVDSAVGKTVYDTDGTTVLTALKSGVLNIASPFAFEGGFYAIAVSIGGVLRWGALKAADCTNVRELVAPTEPTWTSPDGKVQVIYEGA